MPHPLELQRGSNRLFKCTYSVINNWLLFGLTFAQNRKSRGCFTAYIYLWMKSHPTNNICKQRRSPKETEALNIWTLICEITVACTREINEYKQNRFNTFGNKFCKLFSHYKFLVQLVFAPHFKQKHVQRYDYICNDDNSKTHVKSSRAMTHQRASAASKNCEILLFPLTHVFDTKAKCATRRAPFGSNSPLYGA